MTDSTFELVRPCPRDRDREVAKPAPSTIEGYRPSSVSVRKSRSAARIKFLN